MSTPFVISFWSGPQNEEISIEAYKQIKAAGFTTVCGSVNQHFPPEQARAMLAAAEAVGLTAIVSDDRIVLNYSSNTDKDIDEAVAEWSQSPALLGYYITDEPGAGSFETLERIVRRLRFRDPTRLNFINFLPLYWPPLGGSEADYISFVTHYLNVVHPNIVSFDHYFKGGFTTNCRIIRDLSFQRDKDFWVIINACSPGALLVPPASEPFMRWQAMEALRHGTRGILYFCYRPPPGNGGPGDGMIDATTGKPTPRYNEVATLNADIQAVVNQYAEVLFGRVRPTPQVPGGSGDLWLVASSDIPRPPHPPSDKTARKLIARDEPLGQAGAGWDWTEHTMPGYGFINQVRETWGFWLSAQLDLLNRTFYVLNVVNDVGTLYEVSRNSVSSRKPWGWNQWPQPEAKLLGMHFESNGFQIWLQV